MIELEHVTKKYGSLTALDDVSFKAQDGRIIGLLGRNGAGKSTALNLMTGYFPPDHGRVTVNGKDMLKDPRACRRMIGYLPERPPLYDEMTVSEFLRFVCGLKEVAKCSVKPHTDEIIELCGLEEMRDRLIGRLSKGYRQRVGIAQALCGDPESIIMDEPTVGLDPQQVTEIRTLIRRLGEKHTVFFSSHILSEVQELCGHVIILHHGKAILDHDLPMTEEENGTGKIRLIARGDATEIARGLKSLPGLQRLRGLGNVNGAARFEILCDRENDGEPMEARIFRLLAALDAPIMEMTREKDTLENIFLKATADTD